MELGTRKDQEPILKLVPALIFCLLLSSACPAQDRFDMEAGRKLFGAKCSPCHPLERTLRKIKDRDGWQKTVERMKSYAPGQITGDDAHAIVEYLSRVRGAKP